MKIEVTLHRLKVKTYQGIKAYIAVSIDEYTKFQSSQEVSQNGQYNFMEKNIIEFDKPVPQYIQFDFMIGQNVIARKSLFYTEAVDKHQINLNPINKTDNNTYTLDYEIKASQLTVNKNGVNQYVPFKGLRRRKTLDEQVPSSLGYSGQIKTLQLGKLTYNFAKRLDIMVEISNRLQDVLFWKRPQETIGLGVALTFIILFPKLSILILSICLIFGRNYIINRIERSALKRDTTHRLLPPQQNLKFLKDFMELYCDTFQSTKQFLQEDDRTKIITIVQILCKFGVVIFILSLIFSFEAMLIMAIWGALFMTSSSGKRMTRNIWPKILNINTHVDNVISNVSQSSVARVLKTNSGIKNQVVKEFFIYEYQRWWVGKQWASSYYSDQNREIVLQARKDPPAGWKWINSWEIQYSNDTDGDGYQYTNDFLKNHYDASKALKTIRRRKWKRTCIKQNASLTQSPPFSKKIQSQLLSRANFRKPQTDRGASTPSKVKPKYD